MKRDLSSKIVVFQSSRTTKICEVGWNGDVLRTMIQLDFKLYPDEMNLNLK